MNENRSPRPPLTLATIREAFASRKGQSFWRGLHELVETPEFEELVQKEFPSLAPAWGLNLDRREMLKLMGASLALAGLTACSSPPPQ